MKNALQLPWLDRFYLIRVATVLMVLAIVTVRDTLCVDPLTYHPGLVLFGIVYPHLVQLVLGRFEGRRLQGRYSLLADGIFAGAAMQLMAFAPIPSAVLIAINLFNWMALGGAYLAILGILALLAGVGLSGAAAGFGVVAVNSCAPADILAYGILLAYFLVVAWIVFRYSTALRNHCDELQVKKDAAEMSCRRAEQALMAVLPNSVAADYANGSLGPQTMPDATLLLADFYLPHEEAVDISKLQAIFRVCDEILSRHEMEAVKTFGRRYLALAGKEAGPENALVAALEIVAFLRDHEMVSDLSDAPCGICLAIHSGPVVAGLVQAEKFSYDVLGPTVDEVTALVEKRSAATILISAAARARLQRNWRLAPLPGGDEQSVFTPVEHGGV